MASKPAKSRSKAKPRSARTPRPLDPAARARAVSTSGRGEGDWRDQTLDRVRALIFQAVPEMIEERKWRKPSNAMAGIPVWSGPGAGGMVCTGEIYKNVVKLTFAHGAALPDPSGLFNAGLGGGTRRAIDIREGEMPDAAAFKRLVQAAVNHPAVAKRAKKN